MSKIPYNMTSNNTYNLTLNFISFIFSILQHNKTYLFILNITI